MLVCKDSVKGLETRDCRGIISNMGDYEQCKDRLYFRLVNAEKKKGLLEGAPHTEILDLAMVCYILLSNTEEGMASVAVTDSIAGHWGVQAGELMAQAVRNAQKILPIKVCTLLEEVERLSGIEGIGRPSERSGAPEAFIMTNRYGLNGFGAVLYTKALEDLADILGNDLYVLPSSCHEAILFPADGSVSACELRYMVQSVNETKVAEEDFLSDSVYFYGRAKNELRVTGKEGLCVKL